MLSQESSAWDDAPNPLTSQLLAGELPLTLGCLFPEIKAGHEFTKSARKILSAGVVNALDDPEELERMAREEQQKSAKQEVPAKED